MWLQLFKMPHIVRWRCQKGSCGVIDLVASGEINANNNNNTNLLSDTIAWATPSQSDEERFHDTESQMKEKKQMSLTWPRSACLSTAPPHPFFWPQRHTRPITSPTPQPARPSPLKSISHKLLTFRGMGKLVPGDHRIASADMTGLQSQCTRLTSTDARRSARQRDSVFSRNYLLKSISHKLCWQCGAGMLLPAYHTIPSQDMAPAQRDLIHSCNYPETRATSAKQH